LVADAPFAARFRQGRLRKKLTQARVAAALGISQSAVAQWESGQSFPSPDLAAKIDKLIGVQLQAAERELKAAHRAPLGKRPRLPIIGLPAPGDDERILVDDRPHGEIAAPPQLEKVPGAHAVYVRGHAMEPRYYPGEIVYLHPRPPNPGDFVFLTVKEPGFATAVGYIRQYLGQDLVHVRTMAIKPKREHLVALQDLVEMATIVGAGLL
jgi:transcriptional regulator with XRE-family HTH domain